jgi:hypothetical protein
VQQQVAQQGKLLRLRIGGKGKIPNLIEQAQTLGAPHTVRKLKQ